MLGELLVGNFRNRAKNIWFYNNTLISYIRKDNQNLIKFVNQHYNFYKQYAFLFNRAEYMQLMSNVIFISCLQKDEENFYKYVKELKHLTNQTFEEIIYIDKIIYDRTLEFLHRMNRFQEADSIASKAEKYLEQVKYFKHSFLIRMLQLKILRAYFENNNFLSVCRYSTIKYKTLGDEMDSSLFKLFEFISHYKLNNYENLLYSINSWTKIINNKRKQFPIEKILIKFFRSICNKTTINEKKGLIYITKEKLKELERFEQRNFINYFFDFAAWFERELEEMK